MERPRQCDLVAARVVGSGDLVDALYVVQLAGRERIPRHEADVVLLAGVEDALVLVGPVCDVVPVLDRRDVDDVPRRVQNQYNVAYRDDEDVLQACEEYDVGFIPWGPLYTVDDEGVAGVLDEVGEARDASRRQVALAWLLHHSDVTLPIPGTSSVDHLESNVAASQVELTDEDLSQLNEIDPQ